MIEHDDSFDALYRIITARDVCTKCRDTENLNQFVIDNPDIANRFSTDRAGVPLEILEPGLPSNLKRVSPKNLGKRSIQKQAGRNVLMHAIAHIEFNAINLALDAAYRFRNQPPEYYVDWIAVAADEARHFSMILEYLNNNQCDYGDYPVHNGLWDMAVHTQHDVVARMALVPRVLEARGLDVTPKMIERLSRAGDDIAAGILKKIYNDEIGHVKTGSNWFNYQCEQNHLNPKQTFLTMIQQYLHGELKGPFNIEARYQAGFDEPDIENLQRLASGYEI